MDLIKTKKIYESSNKETLVLSGLLGYEKCVIETLDDYDIIDIYINGKNILSLETTGMVSIMNLEELNNFLKNGIEDLHEDIDYYNLVIPNFKGIITAGVIDCEGNMIENFPLDDYIRRIVKKDISSIFINFPEGTEFIKWKDYVKSNNKI